MATLKPHIAIRVSDLQKSVSFYRKMFAIQPSKVREAYAKFDVANPPLSFTLNETSFDPGGALSHLGIQVSSTADVLAFRERWARAGLPVRDEMSAVCCYALQDKAWVSDPDGNQWEVFVVLKDNLPERADPERTCCPPAAAPPCERAAAL
jgi:catechol 2,3-dioxygenase-like lactoylglutathione lyase family enzyme